MSAIQELLKKKKGQQSDKPTAKVEPRGSAISSLVASKTPVSAQRQADRKKAEEQNKQLDNYKPSLMDKIKSVVGIASPSNIKSTAQNTTKGSLTQSAAAVGSGLLDIGPRIANSVGLKSIVKGVTGPLLNPLTDRIPNTKLPLPGRTAMEYSNNTSDLSNALSEATTQVGGFELGGAVARGVGITNRFASGVIGNVAGGQATTEATTFKDRAMQAGFDAAFGVATEGTGSAIRKLLKTKGVDAPVTQQTAPSKDFTSQPVRSVTEAPQAPRIVTSDLPSTRTAKASSDINTSLVAKGFDELPETQLATYNPITKADQIQKVSTLISEDLEKAKRMAMGAEPITGDVNSQVLFNAVKRKALKDGDANTLRELAMSPVATERSLAAQTLGASGFDNVINDPVTAIQNISKVREAALGKKMNVPKVKTELKNAIKTEIKTVAPKPKDWASFVESLKCK